MIPIAAHKEGVMEKAAELKERISKVARVKLDDSDKTPGFKFAEAEMRGIPVRVEIGPKDIENGKAVLVRRDNGEKTEVDLDKIEEEIAKLLPKIQKDMLDRARAHCEEHTYTAHNKEEFEEIAATKSGFIKAMWCGETDCELKIKEQYGITSRCMPFEEGACGETCICCKKPAKKLVVWGRAY